MIATLALFATLLACQGETPVTATPATSEAPASGGPASTEGKTPVTSATGLTYVVLSEGSGQPAAAGDNVSMQYTGWLTDGTKFDSSRDSGRPFKFTLGAGEVIRGWDEGVAGMKPGEKRQLRIPAKLGYGERGAGGVIPPNADLVFDVELVSVKKVLPVPSAPADVAGKTPVKTASGLMYTVLADGSGATAASGDKVRVHYTGWLTDGTMFDSSLKRGEPIAFPLGAGRVIKGWDEGVAGMKIGEKRQLRIPGDLAYGPRGKGPIPPDATLVFDVELVAIDGK